jgi:uracil-DNA glycosylase
VETLSLLDSFPPAWRALLPEPVVTETLPKLEQRLAQAQAAGAHILPPRRDWFNALSLLAPADVKVVILGQDPYPTAGNAHGLAFSVTRQTKLPGSLRNIFTELASDLGVPPPAHGDLTDWAHQGVLLLNTVLTVEEGQAHAHKNWGWEKVTDAIIAALARDHEGLVFILWGGYAQKKSALIDAARHLIIKEVHPSGLSVYRGFWGSKPFSKANDYLRARGKEPVRWA